MTETSEPPVVAILHIDTLDGSERTLPLPSPGLNISCTDCGDPELARRMHSGESFRVGRSKGNDLVLADPNVSRFHAVFTASTTGVVLSDLSSMNGSFVNGQLITTPIDLGSGDVVTVGSTRFVIVICLCKADSASVGSSDTHLAQMLPVEVTMMLVDVFRYTKISQGILSEEIT